MDINSVFSSVKSSELFGRYITNSHIEKCLNKIPKSRISDTWLFCRRATNL